MKLPVPLIRSPRRTTSSAFLALFFSIHGAHAQGLDAELTPPDEAASEEAPSDTASDADVAASAEGAASAEETLGETGVTETDASVDAEEGAPRSAEVEVPPDTGKKDAHLEEVAAPEPKSKSLWQGLVSDNNSFGIDGKMEIDLGYADYRFDTATYGKETFHDFRGLFDLTPVLEHRFGKDKQAFLRVSADFRAWLREEQGIYQINVYEAFVQAGIDDLLDLQVGRVETWRIVQPGNGFDIYTIEDTGALKSPPYSGGNFYTFRYEVDEMWLVDPSARAALHLYPLKKILPKGWGDLGVEMVGEYGKERLANVVGARGALIYDNQWLRLAGGAEYRSQKSAEEIVSADGTICDQCTWQYRRGMGASAVIRPPYVVGGLNTAKAHRVDKGAAGDGGEQGIVDVQMQGAFIELHTGHLLASTKDGPRPGPLADQRSEDIRKITVGYGHRRAEQLIGNGDFERHTQQAVYLKYNLGFNQAYFKLVGTYAKGFLLDNRRAVTEEPEFVYQEGDLLAARLRFAYYF